jgi:phosphorylase kinase alpha/beta subunit
MGAKVRNHLQLDCVSLYLIYLVQMIASGLQIIYSQEEVALVQNLIYYVERAYRTPDFGMWGRGTKYNDGQAEVNASSIGLAKAALEAVNGFNLFGSPGNHAVVYADIDAHNRNRSIFETLLPRGSNTKNTDASLMCAISWPAFATHVYGNYKRTKNRIIRELDGEYGFKRYIGDGYGCEVENPVKRFYDVGEVMNYEHIENEWPLFYMYMIVDGMFEDDQEQVQLYEEKLEKLICHDCNGDPVIPKMFVVPKSSVDDERKAPRSQCRRKSYHIKIGEPENLFLWSQAMYIIANLLTKHLIQLWDLDPIRRYLPNYLRPRLTSRYSAFMRGAQQGQRMEQVVQIVLIAETTRLQAMLANYGIQAQTPTEVEPVQIWPPSELVKIFTLMGKCPRLGLKGRPERPIGCLGTSKVYRINGKTVLCYPLVFSATDFYLSHDIALLTTNIRSELQFIGKSWRLSGRPTFCVIISEDDMRDPQFHEMLTLLSEFKLGQYGGVKIRLGRLQNLLSSACIEHLDLPIDFEMLEMKPVKENKNLYAGYQSLTDIPKQTRIEEEARDFADEYKSAPSYEIVELIANTSHLYGKIQLCGILLTREGPDFPIGEKSAKKRVEELSKTAAGLRYWSALRYASSLLRKTVDSLTPYATAIIVNGKSLCVGTVGVTHVTFQAPMTPKELSDAIFNKVFPHSVNGAVLQQEMILYCGKIIATNPELFVGILVLRMGWLIRAIDLYKSFMMPEDKNPLDNLPPSKIWSLVHDLLRDTATSHDLEHPLVTDLTDHQIKQLNGCLLRVPDNFYSSVWQILSRCPGGIRFGVEQLPQLPTIKLHEPFELSFYHLVESFFAQYQESCYRHLVIRVLTILAIVIKRNPEIQYTQQICIEGLISESIGLYEKSLQANDDGTYQNKGIEGFNRLSCRLSDSFIGRAIVNTLLGGEIGHDQSECKIQ